MDKQLAFGGSGNAAVAEVSGSPVEQQLSQLASLVDRIETPLEPSESDAYANRLVSARLGVASSLFFALRSKHAPTAAHSLRVALGCSAWSLALKLSEAERDELEIAGLLHDVGKIAVPDAVLLKPGSLSTDEAALMDRYHGAGLDIIRGCVQSSSLVDIVRYSQVWFDGTRSKSGLAGRKIPLGARMLSIVDAFDSMTTDHVYRRALSRERAMGELFTGAGTQFDPDLVQLFNELQGGKDHHDQVAQRWLKELLPRQSDKLWQFQSGGSGALPAIPLIPEELFQQKLLENMHDGVVFVDRGMQIVLWNHGAERLTGIAGASVFQKTWQPSLIGLRDDRGKPVPQADCPVAYAMHSGVQSLRRLAIAGRNSRGMAVDVHALPVTGGDGTMYGAAVLLHDASPEASLEQKCQSLHERATKDPLTQVANRAEFDRAHEVFVSAHLERRLPCSLIICDIDHFKQINDTYGHQAGDEALKSFAQLLKSYCRSGDLVARYGGEEFVMLCADCNNSTAAQRAEQMRVAIKELAVPALSGKRFTVSFGVTEVQPGDTPETMLRRADRALFDAKQQGRNRVVQLGSGIGEDAEKPKSGAWLSRLWPHRNSTPDLLLEKWLGTPVPLNMTIEKLRGFVADHFATISAIEGEKITLQIDGNRGELTKRNSDRPVPFIVELRFSEERIEGASTSGGPAGRVVRTKIYVAVRPKRNRDRRRNDTIERARMVVSSIKSYLMAQEELPAENNPIRKATNVIANLLQK